MPGTIQVPDRGVCPGRDLRQVELMGEVFSDSAEQTVYPRIARQHRLVRKHGDPQLRRRRQIEFIEEFRERLVERVARNDALSCLCEGSGAHRSKFPWQKVVLARSAACRQPMRCSEKIRRESRWPD